MEHEITDRVVGVVKNISDEIVKKVELKQVTLTTISKMR